MGVHQSSALLTTSLTLPTAQRPEFALPIRRFAVWIVQRSTHTFSVSGDGELLCHKRQRYSAHVRSEIGVVSVDIDPSKSLKCDLQSWMFDCSIQHVLVVVRHVLRTTIRQCRENPPLNRPVASPNDASFNRVRVFTTEKSPLRERQSGCNAVSAVPVLCDGHPDSVFATVHLEPVVKALRVCRFPTEDNCLLRTTFI